MNNHRSETRLLKFKSDILLSTRCGLRDSRMQQHGLPCMCAHSKHDSPNCVKLRPALRPSEACIDISRLPNEGSETEMGIEADLSYIWTVWSLPALAMMSSLAGLKSIAVMPPCTPTQLFHGWVGAPHASHCVINVSPLVIELSPQYKKLSLQAERLNDHHLVCPVLKHRLLQHCSKSTCTWKPVCERTHLTVQVQIVVQRDCMHLSKQQVMPVQH